MENAPQNNLQELAGGAGTAIVGRLGGRLLAVVGDILAARVLGPAIFGLYSIGWTVFRLVELVAPVGLDIGVIRYASRHLAAEQAGEFTEVVRRGLRVTLAFSLP